MKPRQQILLTHGLLQISIVLLLLSPSSASLGNNGACQINERHGIEIQEQRIEGRWYLQGVSASYFLQNPSDKCHAFNFTFNTIQTGLMRGFKPIISIQFENLALQSNNTIITYPATGTFTQPGFMNIQFNLAQSYFQFEFIYFNSDFSISVVVGCNSMNYMGSSDVFILSRNDSPTLDEIQKAFDEAERLKFDVSDFTAKNTLNCSAL